MIIGQLIEGDTPGGAERLVIQFARALRARGHEAVTIIPTGGPGWLTRELSALGFPTATIPRRHMLDPRVGRDLERVLRSVGAGALHSHEFLGVVGARGANRLGIPHVITLHGSPYFSSHWRRRLAFKWAAARATRVVGVSGETSRHAERVLGLAEGDVLTITNGVAPRPGERHRVRDELGIAAHELVIAALGNVSERKNHAHLIEAVARVAHSDPMLPWRVVIGGEDRGCSTAIRARAAELGIGARVHLLGYRSDTDDILAAADVFAMPSLHEGMPLAIIEAMFAGLPIVASSVGGVASMLDDGTEGFLHGPADTEALAAALGTLLRDQAQRRRMSQAARARAAAQFGIDSMMDAYMALYVGDGAALRSSGRRNSPGTV